MNIEQFGQQIKAKYPQYADKSDEEVGNAVLQKYPQYQSMVTHDSSGQPIQQEKKYTAGESAIEAAKNIIPSTVKTITEGAKGLGQAVSHPIDTLKSVGQTAAGGIQEIPGVKEFFDKHSVGGADNEILKENRARFDALKNYFGEKYGGWENVKRSFAEDPASVLLDASIVLSGGETALSKLGEISNVSGITKAGEIVGKVGQTIDPITGAVKVAGKVAPKASEIAGRIGGEAIGAVTGTGYGSVKQLYNSIKAGGTESEEAYKALRGTTSAENVVGEVKDALSQIYENRSQQYQEMASKLKTKPGVEGLTTQGVKNIAKDTLKNKLDVPTREVMNPDGTTRLEMDFSQRPSLDSKGIQKVSDTIYGWNDTSIQGINRLKQEIEGFKKGGINLSPADNRFNKFINDTSKGLDKYLKENIEGYSELNKTYKENTDLIKEIEKDLSLGKGKSVDTAYRKLSSVLRTNNEFRVGLAKELDDLSGGKLLSKVAGQQMSEILPRGILRPIEGAGAIGALASGSALPFLKAIIFTSPRVMGEFIGALGYTGRKGKEALDILKKIVPENSPEVLDNITKAGYYIDKGNKANINSYTKK